MRFVLATGLAVALLAISLPASAQNIENATITRMDGKTSRPLTITGVDDQFVYYQWQGQLQIGGTVTKHGKIGVNDVSLVEQGGKAVHLRRRGRGCGSGGCGSGSSCSSSSSGCGIRSSGGSDLLETPGSLPPVASTPPPASTGSDINVGAVTEKINSLEKQIADLKSQNDRLVVDVRTVAQAASQPGPAGPAGPAGPPGQNGANGNDGKQGEVTAAQLAEIVNRLAADPRCKGQPGENATPEVDYSKLAAQLDLVKLASHVQGKDPNRAVYVTAQGSPECVAADKAVAAAKSKGAPVTIMRLEPEAAKVMKVPSLHFIKTNRNFVGGEGVIGALSQLAK